MGVTVGAGICVLVGEVISRSGPHAPFAFLIAGLVMLFPAAVFAELTGRYPFAAAEAHFVEASFNSKRLFLLVGLAVTSVKHWNLWFKFACFGLLSRYGSDSRECVRSCGVFKMTAHHWPGDIEYQSATVTRE